MPRGRPKLTERTKLENRIVRLQREIAEIQAKLNVEVSNEETVAVNQAEE